MRWILQPGDQRHAGRRIAKSAILKMCRRGSAWCGVRLKGFWLTKLLKGVDETAYARLIYHQTLLVLHHPSFVWFSGVDSSRVCFPSQLSILDCGRTICLEDLWNHVGGSGKLGVRGLLMSFAHTISLKISWKHKTISQHLTCSGTLPIRSCFSDVKFLWNIYRIFIDTFKSVLQFIATRTASYFPFARIALRIESGSIQKVKCQGQAVKQVGSN